MTADASATEGASGCSAVPGIRGPERPRRRRLDTQTLYMNHDTICTLSASVSRLLSIVSSCCTAGVIVGSALEAEAAVAASDEVTFELHHAADALEALGVDRLEWLASSMRTQSASEAIGGRTPRPRFSRLRADAEVVVAACSPRRRHEAQVARRGSRSVIGRPEASCSGSIGLAVSAGAPELVECAGEAAEVVFAGARVRCRCRRVVSAASVDDTGERPDDDVVNPLCLERLEDHVGIERSRLRSRVAAELVEERLDALLRRLRARSPSSSASSAGSSSRSTDLEA